MLEDRKFTSPALNERDQPSNIAEMIDFQCQQNADLEVVTFVSVEADGSLSDERRTFAQLRHNALVLAEQLSAKGMKAGDRFAIMMQNHPEFVEAMIAAAHVGAVFIPIDPRTMGDKLSFMLKFAECKGVITADYCLDMLSDVASHVDCLEWIISINGGHVPSSIKDVDYEHYPSIDPSKKLSFTPATIDPKSPMYMLFTSGTTGNPKAVVQTHTKFMASAKGLMLFGIGENDRLYSGLSLTHINAQTTLRTALALAIPAVFSRKFTKSRLWDICRAYDCTSFTLLGGMIPEMFSIPAQPDDNDNPVRIIISAGMPASLWEAYEKRFNVQICEIYGSTEGGGILYNLPGHGPIGSMGKPPKGMEAMTFRADGEQCAPNEPGELCFRPLGKSASPVSYFKNEDASAQKVSDGWFRSGDIAHCDEQGWYFFHHRVGGGVRRNGDFINTALVESVLIRSPLIDDAFVYGVPLESDVAGEKTLIAAITIEPDQVFDEEAIRAFCRENLQPNDIPTIFQHLDAIPKTVSEKPIEKECIKLLEATNAYPLATIT